MTRREFPLAVKRAALARSGGNCECGCGRPFGEHPKERPHYDHVLPDFLGGKPDLENCEVLRVECHDAKTFKGDIPRIAKVRREEKRRNGLTAPKQKLPGSKGSPWKRKMNGAVVRRDEE